MLQDNKQIRFKYTTDTIYIGVSHSYTKQGGTLVTFANVVGRMLCIHPRLSVCLFVCLFVCLLAGLLKKLWTDLNEI